MLLVIDSGNTRTKWALVDSAGHMQAVNICLNADLLTSTLPISARQANKVFIANVAGAEISQKLAMLVKPLNMHFVKSSQQACDVTNMYESAEKLGVDRWAGLIAAWGINKQTTLVVNAGTAITIDCLVADKNDKGVFLGGTIMPGLRMMQYELMLNTAQLKVGQGIHTRFPLNTEGAIYSGCLNAVIGAVEIMNQQLEKHSGIAPKLVISGGDATTIAVAISSHSKVDVKYVSIIEHLVLQGLVMLQKEYI